MTVEPMMSIVERALYLMEIDVFHALQTEQVARIAAHTTERHYPAGTMIPNPESGMFLVLEGRIDLLAEGNVIRSFTKGKSFGLSALLGGAGAAETEARAGEDTHALFLPKEDFLDTVNDHPEVAVALLRRLSEMILDLLRRVEMLERQASVPVPPRDQKASQPSHRESPGS
jgi:CRP-like cAMP-binding protein